MVTGTLALLLMVNTLGATDGQTALKDRSIAIPCNLTVNPADVQEVVLFVSIDQGRLWSRAAAIGPNDRFFAYQAPSDGVYWFNIAVVYKNGTQVPADVRQTPVQQKVLFDTIKPIVRLVSAERFGEEVVVTWDIQEVNPDLASLKLEYRPADVAASGFGYPVAVNPGMVGSARFRPNTPGPITVRLAMQDTAGNLGWAEKNIGAAGNAIAGVTPVPNSITQTVNQVPASQAPGMTTSHAAPAAQFDNPGVQPLMPPPAEQLSPAASQVSVANSLRNAPSRDPAFAYSTGSAAQTTSRRTDLPEIHFTKEPQVTVDYEIESQGPSGISKVEVYLTRDDGRTWMKWQDLTRTEAGRVDSLPDKVLPVTLRLPEPDGLYGFRIVPYSGVQLSTGAPQNGDAPEVRIFADRTAPYVEMFKPEPDAKDPNILVLQWRASDTNLTDQPIRIYWSDSPNGEWKSIVNSLDGSCANTGRYAWTVPQGLPLKVFLRITAEDKAGNVGEATTPQPLAVDLHKPVGRIRAIAGKPKS
jgi:hypothetical protein